MQSTITLEKQTIRTSQNAKALVLLDVAASHCQALIRLPNRAEFKRLSFESSVKPLSEPDGVAIQIETTDNNFSILRVGNAGTHIEEFRTGATIDGKVKNAKALMIHAIMQAVELSQFDIFHADVLFTTPHSAKFGPEIKRQLEGLHKVVVPKHAEDFQGKDQHYTIQIHSAFADMEGRRAFHLIPRDVFEGDSNILLLDIGSLTGLVYCLNKAGAIVDKQWDSIPDKGVHALAELCKQDDSLADLFPPMPTPHQILDVLFGGVPADGDDAKATKAKAGIRKKLAKRLQPLYAKNFSRLNQVAERFGSHSRFVVGGGANLPGLAEFLKAQTVGSDPQWAALEGAAMIADQFIKAKRQQEGA